MSLHEYVCVYVCLHVHKHNYAFMYCNVFVLYSCVYDIVCTNVGAP